jgi:molybdopterin-guanine dinucleotide biosynthesis protein A
MDFQNLGVVIPQYQGRLEPPPAIYKRQTCLEPAEAYLGQGGRKIVDWFFEVKVKVIDGDDFSHSILSGQAFLNVNTPED